MFGGSGRGTFVRAVDVGVAVTRAPRVKKHNEEMVAFLPRDLRGETGVVFTRRTSFRFRL